MLWSPTFFQPRTDQRLENFNAAREYSMMVVILQQLKWSYQFEPSDKAAAACLCARLVSGSAQSFLPVLFRQGKQKPTLKLAKQPL